MPFFQKPNSRMAYPMKNDDHGLCLIINNEIFEKYEPRIGSSEDVKRLQQLFGELGFSVITKKNLTIKEMEKVLNNFVKKDEHKKSEMCVVIVMSHGKEGCFETTDGNLVSKTKYLLLIFFSPVYQINTFMKNMFSV